jgi:hypothetical protein
MFLQAPGCDGSLKTLKNSGEKNGVNQIGRHQNRRISFCILIIADKKYKIYINLKKGFLNSF